jgi:hypothetical protein
LVRLRTEDNMAKVKLNAWANKIVRKTIAQVLRKVGVTDTLLFILDIVADMTETEADDKIVAELKKALNPK